MVALVSMVSILFLTSLGIHRVYFKRVIASAEEDAVSLGKMLLVMEKAHFLQPGAEGLEVGIDKAAFDQVDGRWRQFLEPFEIVKIKIFDDRNRIVYSTDHSIIGKFDHKNKRLQRALAGHNDSHLETKDQMLDLALETKFDMDVVETYVPIKLENGKVIGAFELYRDVTRYRNEVSDAVLKTQVILGLIMVLVFGISFVVMKIGTDQLAKAQAALKEMAIRDPLTGILNRRETLKRGQIELSRISRHQALDKEHSLVVLMVDIDFFKPINDTFGHCAGDFVLKEVSRRLQKAVRQYDILGRYGGEEFLILLPESDLSNGLKAAEKVRQAIANRPFDIDGKQHPLTVSIGVTLADQGEKDLDETLNRADKALYQAKHAGRNRVSWVENAAAVQQSLFKEPAGQLKTSA
ncbi:MAG TPA: GGDEF domain-containing protein [Desulfuromonadales bacterium]|nr:GGDEF domain-containing protein [Desulfuromonadales bacterium]